MSSRGTSSLLSIEWVGRVKWSEHGGWLINVLFCDGFFNSASVLTNICRWDDILSRLYSARCGSSVMKGHVYLCDKGKLPKPGALACGVWSWPVRHVGFCNGGTICEEEKKILLGTVAKNGEFWLEKWLEKKNVIANDTLINQPPFQITLPFPFYGQRRTRSSGTHHFK